MEADTENSRPYNRLNNQQIAERVNATDKPFKPWLYMDAIDSVLNTRPDINLVVGDGRSTESIRQEMLKHQNETGGYHIEFYSERMSQWVIFNDIINKHATPETEYFVYSSSDIIWQMDWVAEAIKAFEANPKLQILFPCVNNGDANLPCQIAAGPRDIEPLFPPYQEPAEARVLNAYAMIFRMDFLRTYGGYPTLFRNCFSESFLHYMCEAMGGEQRLLPRGWCFHYGTQDIWQENGSFYYYNEEKMLFHDVMNKLKMAKAMGLMSVDFLKNLLYKGK